MMVFDGFFLIELFRKVGKVISTNQDDPLFRMAWVFPFLMRDLLRIENQIPFFVLQTLFNESKPDARSLPSLVLEFFNSAVDRPNQVLKEDENHDGKHLLDFFRKSFINTKKRYVVASKANKKSNNLSLKLIEPATKLANHNAESFLDIEFQNGILLIPQINMDDFFMSFLLNCVAFEQCYFRCSKDITTYVVFMGCLMNTSTDVGGLTEKRVISYFGTDKEIAKFFNNIRKNVAFDFKDNYLFGLCKEVDESHLGWAGFMHTYYENPLVLISALVSFILLFLSMLQTFYAFSPNNM